jgi:hypothetical protein
MITRFIKPVLALAILASSVALPLTVYWRNRSRIRALDESLRQQSVELAQCVLENQRASNSVARETAAPLSAEELAELLRLRNEVSRLRRQTNALQRLQQENRQLQSRSENPPRSYASLSETERNLALSGETIAAMKNVLAELAGAIQEFSTRHDGRRPVRLAELREFFPTHSGRMAGLYTFEFARDKGPLPGDTLILLEPSGRSMPDGKKARVYAFSDGTVQEMVSTDADFEAWLKEHVGAPPPSP